MSNFKRKFIISLSIVVLFFFNCSKSGNAGTNNSNGNSGSGSSGGGTVIPQKSDVAFWLTKGDQSALLQSQTTVLSFNTNNNNNPTITVDTTTGFQSIDGFGYCLTDASASLIYNLDAAQRDQLLKELFGNDSTSIGISYLRLSIGASDLSETVYTYDDVAGDVTLQNFNLRKDLSKVVPLLKLILAIRPDIKILGSSWTAPLWMKSNNSSNGGNLLTGNYSTYANYFVKYIQQMKLEGITIDAITPQNEPLNPNNNPSMSMSATEQTIFIRDYLGPAFKTAGISTKIIAYDHNCDRPDYPLSVLSDPIASQYVNGAAFHLYAGDISALSSVHNSFPAKNIYFTEQYTASNGDFAGDLKWHVKNVIIGSMRNWSRNALEWNLANDILYSGHTPGGCNTCKGALTIGSTITRNVSYYIIAHASKFITPGSVRIFSDQANNLYTVAFNRPDGKKVLIVENDGSTAQTFNIKFNGQWVSPTLPGSSVGTFVW